MRIVGRILKWLVVVIVAAVVGGAGWLYFMPPELLRVGTAYAAKIVCSNVFIAGRDARQVLAEDVQAPGHPLLKYLSAEVTGDLVTAKVFGFVAEQTAVYRPGLGCAVVADGNIEAARAVKLTTVPVPKTYDFEWPLGDQLSRPTSAPVEAVLADDALAGPGMRAIVVVKDGRIIAERYAAGFTDKTSLMGWSMTKTVTAALIASRVADGKLSYDAAALFPEWNDDRARIKISDLMAMQSGLNLEESYGDVNDVTRMLFLEPDQAGFVEGKALEAQPGTKFEYTTGSAVLLSRLWMNTFADAQEALSYPRTKLFGPLGMSSAVIEADEKGTFSGGSLMYASARDWARFGLLLAGRGDWNGIQLLPDAFADLVSTPTTISGGIYTGGLAWKFATGDRKGDVSNIPADTYWAIGNDGQSMAIVPSENLVVVRLGLTPSKLKYRPQQMLEKIVEAARIPVPDPEPDLGVIPQ